MARIGIFDSGVGGLNVLHNLILRYPNNQYIYYGDTKNVPYGDKSKDVLLKLSLKIIDFFEKKQVDLIIIACGTISSNCKDELITKTKIPIYDIITPTIKYINSSFYNNIGLIGTNKTIKSKIFEKHLINKSVLSKATPSFVTYIENNQILENKDNIVNELTVFKNKIDCLILGCTHYPLLSEVIEKYLQIPLIDMGKILSKEINLSNNDQSKIELYFSLLNNDIIANINNIILKDKEIIEIS